MFMDSAGPATTIGPVTGPVTLQLGGYRSENAIRLLWYVYQDPAKAGRGAAKSPIKRSGTKRRMALNLDSKSEPHYGTGLLDLGWVTGRAEGYLPNEFKCLTRWEIRPIMQPIWQRVCPPRMSLLPPFPTFHGPDIRWGSFSVTFRRSRLATGDRPAVCTLFGGAIATCRQR